MKQKKRKINYHEHETPQKDSLPADSGAASAQECTGLMYRTPQTSDEWESLQQLSPMGIHRVKGDIDRSISPQYTGCNSKQEDRS